MTATHNSDIIARVLEYANSPKETAARRWCLSKAWLRAHDAPALWLTLTLTTLPTDWDCAHCIVSAWARAPQRIRTLVERHTRCVRIFDGGPLDSADVPDTPYTLGSGLAEQHFARLEKVVLGVENSSTQDYAADRAALEPLFGVAWLDVLLSWFGDGFLSMARARDLLQNFPNVRLLALPDRPTPLFSYDRLGGITRCGLLALDVTKPALLDQRRATQLVELIALSASSFFCHPVTVLDGLFPHLTRLELRDNLSIQELPAIFANVARACPVLEILTLNIDGVHDTWRLRDNYSVFAHAPQRLKALFLCIYRGSLPLNSTASQFVALIRHHLPAVVGLHVSTYGILEDDGMLPVGPWAPDPTPLLGGACWPRKRYDDAALARTTYTPWGPR